MLRYLVTIPPNGVSVHMTRIFASAILGSSWLSLGAMSYAKVDLKRRVFISRIISGVPLLACVVYAQLRGGFSIAHVLVGVTGAGSWSANALLGLLMSDFVTKMEQARSESMTSRGTNIPGIEKFYLGQALGTYGR